MASDFGDFTPARGRLNVGLSENIPALLPSAATVLIGTAESNTVLVSGTTTITSFGVAPYGTFRRVRFTGALTLTRNATSLELPTSASITTAANDVAEFYSLGGGNWFCLNYMRANGTSLGAVSITGWTPSLNTASPNNTVNASRFLASGGTTNQAAVLQSKGTGATQAQLADSGIPGGNVRGTYATDWQKGRNAADEVASGAYSTIPGGFACRAAGDYAVVSGYQNSSNGNYAACNGGANWADLLAGQWNSWIGGNGGTVEGGSNTIMGGEAVYVNGNWAVAIGLQCRAYGIGAWAIGNYAGTHGMDGSIAWASGNTSSAVGTVQTRSAVLSKATTDGSTYQLVIDGFSAGDTVNQFGAITAGNTDCVLKYSGQACAIRSNGDVATWDLSCTLRYIGGTLAIVGTSVTTKQASSGTGSAWTLAFAADNTNKMLNVNVTGAASQNIKWSCWLNETRRHA